MALGQVPEYVPIRGEVKCPEQKGEGRKERDEQIRGYRMAWIFQGTVRIIGFDLFAKSTD
jgi:hypothetical protein